MESRRQSEGQLESESQEIVAPSGGNPPPNTGLQPTHRARG